MVNTMLCMTLTIQMTNSALDITHDEQYYTWPVDMDVLKCLLSKVTIALYKEACLLDKGIQIVP